jgi:hypothetical protein
MRRDYLAAIKKRLRNASLAKVAYSISRPKRGTRYTVLSEALSDGLY